MEVTRNLLVLAQAVPRILQERESVTPNQLLIGFAQAAHQAVVLAHVPPALLNAVPAIFIPALQAKVAAVIVPLAAIVLLVHLQAVLHHVALPRADVNLIAVPGRNQRKP